MGVRSHLLSEISAFKATLRIGLSIFALSVATKDLPRRDISSILDT
jgi:hypothetical protein